MVCEGVELLKEGPRLEVLLGPLVASKRLLEVVGVEGNSSGKEVREVLGASLPVILSEQVLVLSHLECCDGAGGTHELNDTLLELRLGVCVVVEVVIDDVSNLGGRVLAQFFLVARVE